MPAQVSVTRLTGTITIDGDASEAAWASAPAIDGFVEYFRGDTSGGTHAGEAFGPMQLDGAVAADDGIVAVEEVGVGHVAGYSEESAAKQ